MLDGLNDSVLSSSSKIDFADEKFCSLNAGLTASSALYLIEDKLNDSVLSSSSEINFADEKFCSLNAGLTASSVLYLIEDRLSLIY